MIIYDEVDDLVTQVGAILTAKKDCLGMLEVDAHANPRLCNQLTVSNADAWGQELMKIVWCDNAFLYLGGCNTGDFCLGPGWNNRTPKEIGSIARVLADAMPYSSSSFPIHLTVFGARGFITGTHITGTEECHQTCVTGHLWWKQYHGRYGNAIDATGAAVWEPFKNW